MVNMQFETSLGLRAHNVTAATNILHNAMNCKNITKTRLYNFDPLQPHFYIVKLGFTGV